MTVEEGARLRAARSAAYCGHAMVAAEYLSSGEPTGAHLCTTCGDLLSVAPLTALSRRGLAMTPTFRPLRRFQRVPVQLKGWFWLDGERTAFACTCVSLSLGGAALQCQNFALERGMMGQLVVVLDDGQACLVEASSVQWSRHEQFAVEFLAMPASDLERVKNYLATRTALQSVSADA